ncbi:MAG: VCBS repeat-containing protein [Bacteroidetes bacterium]|nr:MAG: VCBS repeat-containing protein [Bacteroidota bacterium]
MKKKRLLLFYLFIYFSTYFSIFSQDIVFEYKNIPLKNQKGEILRLGSAGGFNSPQIYSIDLDLDSKEDLVIFDRSNYRFLTFLAKNNQYEYAPQFEKIFPTCQGWIVLIDVDNDGLKDIFTNNFFLGVSIYKQKKIENKVKFDLFIEEIQTKKTDILYTLNIPLTDIPAIVDIDNDGDLDIITFEYWQGKNIELHENITPKNNKEKLLFKQKTSCWANLHEGLECGEFYFENCEKPKGKGGGEVLFSGLTKDAHAGSTIHLFDVNGDKKLDILIGDAACQNLYVFLNEGNNQKPKFKKMTTNFPISKPIQTFNFPAIFFLDVDFDAKIDMLVAPNLFISKNNKVNFSKSLHFYKNTGSNQKPNYQFICDNFLQNEMIDIGENAKVRFEKDSLMVEPKTGDELVENDGKISQIFFEDFDGDGEIDSLLVHKKGFITCQNKILIQNLGQNPFITLKDYNQDKKLDIFIGTSGGGVQYYENTSKNWQLQTELSTDKKMIKVRNKTNGRLFLKKINHQQIYVNIFINAQQFTPIDISDVPEGKYEWILEKENGIKLIDFWEFKK